MGLVRGMKSLGQHHHLSVLHGQWREVDYLFIAQAVYSFISMNSTWVVVVMASCIAAAFLTEMRRKQPHLFIILNSFSVFLLILNTEV